MFKRCLFVVLILIFITVGCASADTLIKSGQVGESGGGSISYQALTEGTGGQTSHTLYGFYVKNPTVMGDIKQLTCVYDTESIYRNPTVYGKNEYIETSIENDAHEVIGNSTIMFTYSADDSFVYVRMVIADLDREQMSTNSIYHFTTTWGGNDFKIDYASSHPLTVYSDMEDKEVWFADNPTYTAGAHKAFMGYGSVSLNGCEDHYYNLWAQTAFKNLYQIYSTGDSYLPYKFTIQRENIPDWSDSVKSKWVVMDDIYTYTEEEDWSEANESFYMFPSMCDVLHLNCTSYQYEKSYLLNLTDLCDAPDPGYYNLSGYTRSIEGNLIPSVKLTAGGQTEYSDNVSGYTFENLETGSLVLKANKTGFYNTSESLYIGLPGDYVHDVYLIPLDALEEGEFGGMVYDYCSLEPLQGAYVYLFNESADSGKYVYSNKYGFYRFAELTEGLEYQVSTSKEGYAESIIHSFTFNESNINETFCKTKNVWLMPEGGCPKDEDGGGGVPTAPPSPTPTPHEWSNEEIVSWLRTNLMVFFILVFLFTFMWFIRRAGGSKR